MIWDVRAYIIPYGSDCVHLALALRPETPSVLPTSALSADYILCQVVKELRGLNGE